MYWARFHGTDRAFDAFLALLRKYPTTVLGPAHGNVIVGNIDELVAHLRNAINTGVGRHLKISAAGA